MIAADESGKREELMHDSMEQWKATDIVLRQFYSLYFQNATQIASYVLNQYHANNNEQPKQQHNGVFTGAAIASNAASSADTIGYAYHKDGAAAPGFSTSVSNVIHSSSGGWPRDSNPEEDLLMMMSMMDSGGFNESYGNDINSSAAANSSGSNSTSFHDDSFSSPYLMPWPQRTSWIVVFAVLVIVAAVGNSLVAWIVFGQLNDLYFTRIIYPFAFWIHESVLLGVQSTFPPPTQTI
jgi:hypothetical protein